MKFPAGRLKSGSALTAQSGIFGGFFYRRQLQSPGDKGVVSAAAAESDVVRGIGNVIKISPSTPIKYLRFVKLLINVQTGLTSSF